MAVHRVAAPVTAGSTLDDPGPESGDELKINMQVLGCPSRRDDIRASDSLRSGNSPIQDQLGHSSIVLTADIYTSVLPTAQHKAAEATARLVLDAARNDRNKIATVARRIRVTAQQTSEGIASHTTSRPEVIAGHRPSTGYLKRSSAVATARQPPSTENSMNTYIRC